MEAERDPRSERPGRSDADGDRRAVHAAVTLVQPAQLLDSTLLLRAVVDAALEGVWVTDAVGRTVLVNAQMAHLIGVGRFELDGRSVLDFFDPPVVDLIRDRLRRRKAGVSEQYELSFLRRDGQWRHLRVSAAPRWDLDGRYLGAIAMCTDLTDERRLTALLDAELDHAGLSLTDRSHVWPAAPVVESLSPREIEVVRLLVQGDRVPGIARQRGVSKSTVRNQLSSVYRKLGVGSQQELITLLREGIRPDRQRRAED